MASQEDVDEINTYLQQHAQRQAAKGAEQHNLLTALQHALFGETHADYAPPAVSASAPKAPEPAPLTAPTVTPAPVKKVTPAIVPTPKEEIKKEIPVASVKEKTILDIAPPSVAANATPEPQAITPKIQTPPTRMSYKLNEESEKTPLSPPPARFNPYPNPYHKAIPSPEKFSDSTAPPWVMRSLPNESRDTRKENESVAVTPILREKETTQAMPATPAKKTSPAITPVARDIEKGNQSTRAKMIDLVHETNGKDGNNSPHSMPWHADNSGEVTANELVGLAPSTPVNRAPITSTPTPLPAATPRPTPSAPAGLQQHEHEYLLRKEQEYDTQLAKSASSLPSAALAGENTSVDEKKAILGRLKELMAQHGEETPQN